MTAVWRGWSSLVGVLLVALAVGVGASPTSEADADEAQALAAAIQQHYERIRDFRADFTHTYEGGVLRKKTVERGQMAIRKPGRMRWTYTSPEHKVFVSDGVKLYSYVPADKQVYVATVPTGDDASTPAMFLAGKGHLTRDFTAAPAAPAGAPVGSAAITLTPIKPEREYETLVLVVDRESLQWRMLVTTDRQGGTSTFAFTNLRENTGVPDREFVFTIPRGVDVITDAGR
ncbi:MAG: outer membrane lipoprotein carrier protein LolA [Vicinamibacteria bacterium]|nr:outer membrane lipoprotein carrier protein LolA [Vicinamibacteria bacterium]